MNQTEFMEVFKKELDENTGVLVQLRRIAYSLERLADKLGTEDE